MEDYLDIQQLITTYPMALDTGASAVVLPSGAVLVSGGDEAGSAELYTGR